MCNSFSGAHLNGSDTRHIILIEFFFNTIEIQYSLFYLTVEYDEANGKAKNKYTHTQKEKYKMRERQSMH